jgi:DNA-binding CsgD family transcriptional regulator
METWWSELDDEVCRCLLQGALSPAEIGRRIGLSEDAATSLVTLLAQEGRVRICLVAARIEGSAADGLPTVTRLAA